MNGSSVPRDRELSAYLGFPLEITATEVVVSTPAGRRVGRATSVKQARLLIRSYRWAMRPGSSSRVERVVADLGVTGSASMTSRSTDVKETA